MKALLLATSVLVLLGCDDSSVDPVSKEICGVNCIELDCGLDQRLCLQEGCSSRCGRCLDGWVESDGTCVESVDTDFVGPYKVGRDYFQVWNGSSYDRLFIKGVDLGVGMPGTQPGDLAPSYDDYSRWFPQMAEAGFNTLRIYTLHFPRFYEAFRDYNLNNPDKPLYLFHGVWLTEDNPTHDLHLLTRQFDMGIEEVIDAVHGSYTAGDRFGRAYGVWTADVSQWVIGYIIGREVFAAEVLETDELHPSMTSFSGASMRLESGNPSSVWMAARLDHTVIYERETYGVDRPVAFSNWLELDPLDHPTESRATLKDVAAIDLADLDTFGAPAGHFASFHVYPYYPMFVSEDPGYQAFADDLGPNSYLGLLVDLRTHFADIPVLAAEFGVPASWGTAKFSYSGMHHGGHSETQQGIYGARMLQNIHDAQFAGGLLFHWMDGWYKRVWITRPRTFPADRLRLWHDMTNPQQHYGIIAFDLGEPDFESRAPTTGRGAVREIRAAIDAEFFHTRIRLDHTLEDGERIVIGFDTYGDDVGERVLPGGSRSSLGSELALEVRVPDVAQLYVMESYDLFGIGASTFEAHPRSTRSDGGDWLEVRWLTSLEHQSDDGSHQFTGTVHEIGRLSARRASEESTSLDAVVVDEETLHVRVPWTLLQFTDPSTRSVFDDNPDTASWDATVTDGIALVVGVGDTVLETDRFAWEGWDRAPETTERHKASFEIYAQTVRSLPGLF